jgi:hypothetical protein
MDNKYKIPLVYVLIFYDIVSDWENRIDCLRMFFTV